VPPASPYTVKTSPRGSHEIIVSLVEGPALALDLGCGNGLLTARLLARGVRSIGIDLVDPRDIRAPFEAYHQLDLERPETLPRTLRFDYVILADILEHLRNAPALLAYAASVLKPGGHLIVSVPNIALWYFRLSLAIGRFEYGPKGTLDETHVRFYTWNSFCRLLDRTGFAIVERRVTSLPFEVVAPAFKPRWILAAIDHLYHWLARAWPRLFAYQFVVKAAPIARGHSDGQP
jgi:SAM-dependent methyltransferase